jgi:hypothetical protein
MSERSSDQTKMTVLYEQISIWSHHGDVLHRYNIVRRVHDGKCQVLTLDTVHPGAQDLATQARIFCDQLAAMQLPRELDESAPVWYDSIELAVTEYVIIEPLEI